MQRIPSCSQTGTPLHFHSSTTSGSASLTRAAKPAEQLAPPVAQLLDPRVDQLGRTSFLRLARAHDDSAYRAHGGLVLAPCVAVLTALAVLGIGGAALRVPCRAPSGPCPSGPRSPRSRRRARAGRPRADARSRCPPPRAPRGAPGRGSRRSPGRLRRPKTSTEPRPSTTAPLPRPRWRPWNATTTWSPASMTSSRIITDSSKAPHHERRKPTSSSDPRKTRRSGPTALDQSVTDVRVHVREEGIEVAPVDRLQGLLHDFDVPLGHRT